MGWYSRSKLFDSSFVFTGESSLDYQRVVAAARAAGYNIGPVYHGSSDPDIRVFDPKRIGSIQVSDWGRGFYFTPNRGFADTYRETAVEKTDARADELWEEYEEAARKLNTTPMMSGLDLGRDSKEYAYLNEFFNRWNKYVNELRSDPDRGRVYSVFLSAHNPYYYVPQSITDPYLDSIALGRGHDSIFIVGEYEDDDSPIDLEEILVFKPSQIKSADPITYDDNGDPIPLSARFDSSSDDIRY